MSTPANQALALLTGGGEAGIAYQVTPTITLEGGMLAGVYLGIFGSETGVNPIISAGLGANIKLSPSFSLGINTSYRYYFTRDSEGVRPLWSGLGIGIGTGLSLTRGGSIPKIRYHCRTRSWHPASL